MHRREGDVDFFFVAGEGSGDVELNASCEGRTVEIWDAVKCGRARCPHRAASNGKTRVSLDLPIGGSCFVVFCGNNINNCKDNLALNGSQPRADSETAHSCARNKECCFYSCSSCFQIVSNAWQVSFAYHDGISAVPPAPVTMETLCDWTSFGEDGKADSTSLRYFSGTATYRTTFSWRRDGGIAPYHATLARRLARDVAWRPLESRATIWYNT